MKKAFLSISLIFISIFAGRVQAQTSPQFGVFTSQDKRSPHFGIHGGLNIANISNLDNTDSRTGLMLGVYANLPTPYTFLSIQPEVLYTQKGFESLNRAILGRFDYIEVPILGKFDIAPSYSVAPSVYVGPYAAFNINTKYTGVITDPNSNGAVDIQGPVSDATVGIVVGGGLNFGQFEVGVRYTAGLTNVFKNGNGKNSVFSLVAGIAI